MTTTMTRTVAAAIVAFEGCPDSDAALIDRLRCGESAAYRELIDRCGPRMLSTARRMLGNDGDAEDAVQEAFLSAFKSLAGFDARSQLATWLHRIVVNACLMKMRSRAARPETSIESLLPAFHDDGHRVLEIAAPEDATEPAERRQMAALVRAKIDALPESYRAVIVLRDLEGIDTAETASLLGVNQNVVKIRLHRARQALRTLLVPVLGEDGED